MGMCEFLQRSRIWIDRFRIFSLEDTCAMLSSTEIKNPIHAPAPFGSLGRVKRFLFE